MELDDQPISSGTKELRLELSVLLDENSDTPIVVKRYVEVIRVQVHPWYTSKRMAQDALAVLGALGVSAVCRSRPSPVLVAPATEERRQSAPVSMTEDNRRQVVAVTDHLYSLLKSGLLGLDEQRTAEAQTVVRNLHKAAEQPSVPSEVIRQHLEKAAAVAVAGHQHQHQHWSGFGCPCEPDAAEPWLELTAGSRMRLTPLSSRRLGPRPRVARRLGQAESRSTMVPIVDERSFVPAPSVMCSIRSVAARSVLAGTMTKDVLEGDCRAFSGYSQATPSSLRSRFKR
jgi:hypothetical protein